MRKKIRFYKELLTEIIETLCSICLVLDRVSRERHYPDGIHMYSHFKELKRFSEQLRAK